MKAIPLRTSILFFGVTALGTSASFAQSGWHWKNPLPQGELLYAVAAPDSSTVVAVGALGTIVRSDDGGATWTIQSSGTTESLLGVSFVDSNTGWAVGGNGVAFQTIVHTTDGGATWTPQSCATCSTLYAVSFVDANTGTAVGYSGTILRTDDGGATWTPQSSGRNNSLYGVSFVDGKTGTAVGSEGTILRTDDGGATWTLQPTGTLAPLYGVSFVDRNTGWAVGGRPFPFFPPKPFCTPPTAASHGHPNPAA